MALEFFAFQEGGLKPLHDLRLLGRQGIGVLRVHGGEAAVEKGIVFSADLHRTFFKIQLVEKQLILHLKLGVFMDDLTLQFEHNDGDGFLDPQIPGQVVGVVLVGRIVDLKTFAGIITVDRGGEIGQRNQVDAVAVLQHIEVSIAAGHPDHVGDAGQMTSGSSHPHHVMISPLDIHRLVAHQLVHDKMRPRSAVKNVTHDMDVVHGQTLDQVA